ncbi:MAG: tRNA (adenosine(37)-N6)-threonylcarbamoyltransferase complex transferase subunit TsaD [Candidatus Liptonbacteria bacterium]|nr:tRNA (adenosine(37)-N6)-threonylcarbamoyltransferase complex transferase subunit TsaD [Candidatus Liptonbacteria bacterium]
MRILAIETSCDETSLAILEAGGGLRAPKFKVLEHLVASQIKIHEPFGGVVPNLAKREHLKNLPVLYKKIFGPPGVGQAPGAEEKKNWKKIDFITVTVGPGLEPALWAGIEFAKKLSKEWKKPLFGANHMEGHLWSFLLNSKKIDRKDVFPAVALLVSGGHTILLRMKDLTHWKKLGETRDDAVGEAFDKVARILKLPYPGGPQVEKLALRQAQGKHPDGTIVFPRPMIHDKNYDFSYSGLKTSVLYYCRDNPGAKPEDIAASFQNAATDVLVAKAMRATKEFSAKSIIMAGGVAANKYLRKKLGKEAKKYKLNFFVPGFTFNTDNSAMIGVAGYMNKLRGKKYRLVAKGNLGV